MPISPQQFQILSPEQANPLGEALYKAMLTKQARMEAATKEAELPYAGLSSAANAASKMAYAKLMGPQFMAKLMGNENLLANMDNPKQKLDAITGAAGAGGGSDVSDMIMRYWAQNQGMSPQPQQMQQQPQQQMQQPQMQQAPQQMPQQQAAQAQPQMQQPPTMGGEEGILNYDATGKQVPMGEGDFAENVGKYKESVGKREAAGKERGQLNEKKMGELGDAYMGGTKILSTLDSMIKTVNSPVFENMRQLPILQQHELGFYANYGTPEEKQAVGTFVADQGQLVKDFVQSLGSQAVKSEIGLANSTKPNAADMPDVIKGKVDALYSLTKLANERTALTHDLMRTKGMDYFDAQRKADKMLKGDEIRQQVHDKVYPPKTVNPSHITAENLQYTAKQLGVSVPEVIKRLEAKGIKIPDSIPDR